MTSRGTGLEGRWYITERAVTDYQQLVRPRAIDEERATQELIELGVVAHFVRRQNNGLELWRAKANNGRRLRLLIGDPPARHARGLSALVRVLGEHDGAKR